MATSGPINETAERMILITGTSTGIGLATAVAAAQAGWRTVATMRNPVLGAAGAYAGALRAYLTRVSSQFAGNAQPASEVANIIVALLAAEEPPFRVQTSDWARQFVASKLADVDGSAVQALTTPWVTS